MIARTDFHRFIEKKIANFNTGRSAFINQISNKCS